MEDRILQVFRKGPDWWCLEGALEAASAPHNPVSVYVERRRTLVRVSKVPPLTPRLPRDLFARKFH